MGRLQCFHFPDLNITLVEYSSVQLPRSFQEMRLVDAMLESSGCLIVSKRTTCTDVVSQHPHRQSFVLESAVVTAGRTPLCWFMACMSSSIYYEVHVTFKHFHSTLIMGRQGVKCEVVGPEKPISGTKVFLEVFRILKSRKKTCLSHEVQLVWLILCAVVTPQECQLLSTCRQILG